MPYKEDEHSLDDKMSGNPDVTLEMDSLGNQFLHLVLPADRINFLNGINNTSETFFQGGSDSQDLLDGGCNENSHEPVMIEVGCKVFEVNRIAYRQHKFDIDTNSA